MARCWRWKAATNRIYNCTPAKGCSFRAWWPRRPAPAPRIRRRWDPLFDPPGLNPKARKASPLRLNTSLVDGAPAWSRELALVAGVRAEGALADVGLRHDSPCAQLAHRFSGWRPCGLR